MAFTDAPLVTIITVTYNSSAYVRDAIAGVLSQTHKDFEYIIGDDCSTDTTWDIICEYSDPRIKTYRNAANLREYPNRNKAISMATGKYLIFIDGDDVIYPHALTVFLSYAARFPDCSMYFSREWREEIQCPYKVEPVDIYRFEFLDKGITGESFPNVFFNTNILRQFMLPVDIRSGDSYIQLKIGQHYPALIIPGGLTWWRMTPGNATQLFMSNYKNFAEFIGYRLGFLQYDCPLDDKERKLALTNVYGGTLRLLLRLFLKGKIGDAVYIFNKLSIPFKYYRAVFIRSRYNYFDGVLGDNAFHSR